MAKFLEGNELNSELSKVFKTAGQRLILISPYIKLQHLFADTLKARTTDDKLQITIVFGKNEKDITKSLTADDLDFFKQFPNIEIRYEKRLHAKFYANESSAILTSMNLYTYSQDNNIEAGVMTKATLLGNLASNFMTNVTGEDSFDNQAWTYFKRVIEQSDLLFHKTPQYENAMFGLTKKYKESNVEVDKLTEFFADKPKFESKYRKDNYEKQNVDFQQTVTEIKPEQKAENSSSKISSDTKFLSTTALSKEVGISSKDLFAKFEKLNWIERRNDDWVLTTSGKNKGAQTKKGQYGEYIAWPDTIINDIK